MSDFGSVALFLAVRVRSLSRLFEVSYSDSFALFRAVLARSLCLYNAGADGGYRRVLWVLKHPPLT